MVVSVRNTCALISVHNLACHLNHLNSQHNIGKLFLYILITAYILFSCMHDTYIPYISGIQIYNIISTKIKKKLLQKKQWERVPINSNASPYMIEQCMKKTVQLLQYVKWEKDDRKHILYHNPHWTCALMVHCK